MLKIIEQVKSKLQDRSIDLNKYVNYIPQFLNNDNIVPIYEPTIHNNPKEGEERLIVTLLIIQAMCDHVNTTFNQRTSSMIDSLLSTQDS